MAVTFSWKISSFEILKKHELFEDLILKVHWRYEARDDVDDLFTDIFGVDSLEEPQQDSFTPFSEVGKEEVVSWLEQKMSLLEEEPAPESVLPQEEKESKTRLERMQEILLRQLEEKRSPKIVKKIPSWE
jgi:chaperonin cofactor prefoldin